MESSLHRYRSQLETTPWFRGLCVELQDYLIGHAVLLTLERGQYLYRRGEQSYGLYAASAVSRTLLLHVPEAALQSLLDSTPRYWRDFALLMAQRLRVLFENTEAITLLPAAQRVANRLLMIAGGYGGLNATQSRIRLSQDSLASMVSLSRQTTNQLLRSLESQQIVSLKSGEIAILDFDRLRAASLGDADR
jgi:CRP/FNR family cyclic AMP-dependent transcriptional regulator